MIIVFLGKAGVGKGSYAQLLQQSHGFLQVSMGDVLRQEVAKKTALGKQIDEIMKSGVLVPDSLTAQMLQVWLEEHDLSKGAIFDGFPRTLEQAQMLDNILEQVGQKVDLVLNFTTQEDLLVKRLAGRWTCKKCSRIYNQQTNPEKKKGICDIDSGELYQRPDDQEEAIRKRFAIYDQQVKPIIEYYKGKLIEVDGSKSIQEVYKEVERIVFEK